MVHPARPRVLLVCLGVILTLAGLLTLPATPALARGKVHCQSPTHPVALFAQIDPVTAPGVAPSAHEHEFAGNRHLLDLGERQDAVYGDLVGAATTCSLAGDTAGYWWPSVSSATGRLTAIRVLPYYYSGSARRPTIKRPTEPFPPDLRMVAGNATATASQNTDWIGWSCGANSTKPLAKYTSPAAADCATAGSGAELTFHANFPDCWTGQLNSHTGPANTAEFSGQPGAVTDQMAYSDPLTALCPAGFPHKLPTLRITVHFPYKGDGTDIRLSSGSQYSMHTDFWNTWVQDVLVKFNLDCVSNLGGGTAGPSSLCG